MDLSERTLRTVYFPPFRAALEAGAGTVMSSFNTINGVPGTANPFTLTRVLREEWKFDGFVVSDYESVQGTPRPRRGGRRGRCRPTGPDGRRRHGDGEPALRRSSAPAGRRKGKVPRGTPSIEAVRRILRIKFRLGLFEHPYADEAREARVLSAPEHQAAAREIAARSMVLLKNEGDVLPLKPRGPIDRRPRPPGRRPGRPAQPLARRRPGRGCRDAPGRDQGQGRRAGQDVQVAYAKGCEIEGGSTDGFAEAVRLARQSEVAIVAVGESSSMSGEAGSRSSLDLPGHQLDLVKAVHATGTPTVVVLMNGRPLTIGWVAEHVPAILEAWLPGTQGGHAIADVLFGDVNPGGKLPVTFPRVVGQVPALLQPPEHRPASEGR